MREGVLRLGHANRQIAEALLGEELDLFFGSFRELNTVSLVDVLRHGFNLTLDVERRFVSKLEVLAVFVRLARRLDGVGERDGALAPVRVMGAENGVFRARGERDFTNHRVFRFGVGRERVDGDDDRDTERLGVFDVADQVAHALAHHVDVFSRVRVIEGLTRGHGRTTAVALQRAHGGDDDGAVRLQTRLAALQVDKLFEADVGAEAGFGDDEATLTDHGETDLIGNDGRVTARDVSEWAGVHEHGRRFESLHQRRLDGVAHESHQRAGDAQIVARHRGAVARGADDHVSETVFHVRERSRHRQNRHDFRGDGDVETSLASLALLRRRFADGDFAQKAVVHVDDASPRDALGVDVQTHEFVSLFFRQVIGIGFVDSKLLQALEHDG